MTVGFLEVTSYSGHSPHTKPIVVPVLTFKADLNKRGLVVSKILSVSCNKRRGTKSMLMVGAVIIFVF